MYFILFKSDKNNQWYWSLHSSNHKIIATGAEGYINKQDALHGIDIIKNGASKAILIDNSPLQLRGLKTR